MFNICVQLIMQSLLSYISPLLLNLSVWDEWDTLHSNYGMNGISGYGFLHERGPTYPLTIFLHYSVTDPLSVWNVLVWTLTRRRDHLPTSPLPLRQWWWSFLPPWMSTHLHYQLHSRRLPGTSVQWAPSSEMNSTWKTIVLRKSKWLQRVSCNCE